MTDESYFSRYKQFNFALNVSTIIMETILHRIVVKFSMTKLPSKIEWSKVKIPEKFYFDFKRTKVGGIESRGNLYAISWFLFFIANEKEGDETNNRSWETRFRSRAPPSFPPVKIEGFQIAGDPARNKSHN